MLTSRLPAAVLLLVLLSACGGGSSGSNSGNNGGQMGSGPPEWPDSGGGTTTERPPSVHTGRVVFRSATGETCCVAVDPNTLTGTAANGQSLLVLDNLPLGPATVTVAAFATDFAPAVPDVTATCVTLPPETGQPCDPTQIATPVFESEPLSVVIQSGVQVEIADSAIHSLPFLVNFSPAPDQLVKNPVQFAFTMADAANGVNRDSIEVTVTVNVEAPTETPPFRLLTKRVPLTLTACNDASTPTCSQGGELGVTGFQATGTAPKLPPGTADVHIIGQNLDTPPRDMDLNYAIDVAPDDTPTPTPTVAATPVDTAPSTADSSPLQPVDGARRSEGDRRFETEEAEPAKGNSAGAGSEVERRWRPTPTPTPEASLP